MRARLPLRTVGVQLTTPKEDVMATAAAAIEDRQASVEHFETIVIGGGQAGLSLGYYLKKLGRPFVILDANERIGGSWRTRTWNSLRLFTPARYNGLPGWPFPAPSWSYRPRVRPRTTSRPTRSASSSPSACARVSTG
jgi:hypothetical protein